MIPPRGEGQEPPPSPGNSARPTEDWEIEQGASGNTRDKFNQKGKNLETENRNKASSSTCKPVATNRPQVYFPSERINARIQYMRDHALIGKFIGIWPTERALRTWISTKWRPKGDISLHLGAKGFFTAFFNCLED